MTPNMFCVLLGVHYIAWTFFRAISWDIRPGSHAQGIPDCAQPCCSHQGGLGGWCKVGFMGWGGAFWIKLMLGMGTLHWGVIWVLTRLGQTGGWDWFMVVGQVEGRQNHP